MRPWHVVVAALGLAIVAMGLGANAQAVSTSVARLRQIIGTGPGGSVEVVGALHAEPIRTGRISSFDGGSVLVDNGIRTAQVQAPDAGVLDVGGSGLRIPVVAALPTCSATTNLYSLVQLSTDGSLYRCQPIPLNGAYGWTTGDNTVTTFASGQRVGGQTLDDGRLLAHFTPSTHGVILARTATVLSPGTCSGACTGQPAVYELRQGATRLCSFPVPCAAPESTEVAQAACQVNEFVPGVQIRTQIATDGDCTTNPAVNALAVSLFYVKVP